MPRPNLDPSDLEHFERAIDTSSWDGGAAMSGCAKSAAPASCYGAICAGKRQGDSSKQEAWALPHHKSPGAAPNADGVRNAVARLPQTQGLSNRAAAEAHLQAHMRQISPAEKSALPPRKGLYRAMRATPEVIESESAQPILRGHLGVFNQWAEIDSIFEGHFMERLAPGAYKKTFAENRDRMQILFNHGKDMLGKQVIADLKELREDEIGGYYEGPLLEGVPPLIVSGLRAGKYGSSYNFEIVQEDFVNRPERSDYNPDGIPERTIKEVRVFEFGPVTFPAYVGATAGLRSITDDILFRQFASDPDRFRQLLMEYAPASAAALSHDGAEAKPHSHEESRKDPERLAPLVVIRNPDRRL